MSLHNFSGNNSGNQGNPGGTNIGGIPVGGMQGLPGGDVDATELLINYNTKQTDPALFRDSVINQMLGVLVGKNKPNPLMIGPAGVGKTKIVEEIARRLQVKDPGIPDALQGKVIYELPLSNIVAGSSFVGQVEEKIQAVIAFCQDPKNNVILFIDELHQLTGNSHTYGQVAQILKPALARGDISCIGATTTQEARSLMKDPALNRRFSRIIVDEFTKDQTVELLKQSKAGFILHHNGKVVLTDDIMPTVVNLADEYHAVGSHRPDSALTLLDRAIGDAVVNQKLAIVQAEAAGNTAVVQALKTAPVTINEDKIRRTAIRIMSGGMQQQELDVAALTNDLLKLKGQDDIKTEVIRHLRRRDLGIFPKKKPLSLLFAGSSGVGKTEMTKIIANNMTGMDPIILNMTEYHSSASINRIIGSPVGYIGSESNAELPFDCLESNPYQFILLDEFEKADPAVQKLFMSVLEEGKLKTNRGNTLDFSRCVVIATTNAGHTDNGSRLGFGNDDATPKRKETADTLAKWFNRALLGRFTDILTFNPLSKDVYRDIIKSGYEREYARINTENPKAGAKLQPTLPDDVLDGIVESTYVKDFGARPAEEAVREQIENQLL